MAHTTHNWRRLAALPLLVLALAALPVAQDSLASADGSKPISRPPSGDVTSYSTGSDMFVPYVAGEDGPETTASDTPSPTPSPTFTATPSATSTPSPTTGPTSTPTESSSPTPTYTPLRDEFVYLPLLVFADVQPTATATPTRVILWDDRLTQLRVHLVEADCSEPCWRLKAAWLTVNGNWDDVPDWARQWQQDTLGGDHHVFGRAEEPNGDPIMNGSFELFWPTGGDRRPPEPNGWANLPLYAGYNWLETEGPYGWRQVENGDTLQGVGLPYPPLPWEPHSASLTGPAGGVHVSYFGVWERAGEG